MKQINVSELKPGEVLAKPVLFRGNILLDIGTVLTEEYIKSLKKRGISYVYIEDSDSEILSDEIDDIVDLSSDTLIDELISQLKSFDPSKDKIDVFYDIIDEIGNLKNPKAISVLESLLKKIPDWADEKKVKIHILKALSKIPADSDIGHIFILEFKKENPFEVKLEALNAISKKNNNDYIYPLLSTIKDLDTSLSLKLSDVLINFDLNSLAQNAIMVLDESDDAERKKIINVLKDVLPDDVITYFYKRYLKMDFNNDSKKINEKIKITAKAEDIFQKEPVSRIKTDEISDLAKFDESKFKFRKEDEIRKPKIKKIEVFKPEDEKNLKIAFQRIYNESVNNVQELMQDFRKGAIINENILEEIISKLIIQIKKAPKNVFELILNNTINNYILSHSLNTVYLSLLLGILKNMGEDDLVILGLGSLLHDVGMVKVDLIWNEPRKLNEDERFLIAKHTILGIDSISMSTKFPKDVAYVAYQHHERLDGSGYPKGRKKNLISEYSQIVGLCDVFCAMLSSRVYRRAYTLPEVINYFMYKEPQKYNMDYFKLLLGYIQKYVDPEIINKAEKLSNEKAPKIMVIDDQNDITSLIKEILEHKNFSVITFNNPKLALESYRIEKPDLIIVDLMMPEMGGFEVCKYIRGLPNGNNKPIIVLTVKKDKTSVIKAMQYKVSAYIAKPFDHNEFLNKICSILDRREH